MPAVITKVLSPAGGSSVLFFTISALPHMPPPITMDPLSSCLNDKVRPITPITASRNLGC